MATELDPREVRATAAALRAGAGTGPTAPLPWTDALPPLLQAAIHRVRDRERGVTSLTHAALQRHADALERLADRAQAADAPVAAA